MQPCEQRLAEFAVEDAAYELELLVGVAKAVAVGQEEHLAVDFRRLRFLVQDDTTFLL